MKFLLTSFFTMTSLLFSLPVWSIIIPTQKSNSLVNDPFVSYQWYLNNIDQIIKKDRDDLNSISVVSNPKIQIGWENYDSLIQEDVGVAIVDSGIDKDHPELKGRLLEGINLTTKNPKLQKVYTDKIGHGTHMAGIIGATLNNKEGTSGLTNKVKILPIKVYDNERPNPKDNNQVKMIDRLPEAIDFAIKNQVKVINLSMGWPRVLNTESVQRAFQRAIDADILIVAAAGNDNHDGQIYPCAYRHVVCVGYIENDGNQSDITNFGGHVDMVAPGLDIVSLWPTREISAGFGAKGYEWKSGSSQAAALVSGAAVILRGIYRNESAEQTRKRLLLGTTFLETQTQFGLLNIKNSIDLNLQNKKYIAPVFKGLESVDVNPMTQTFDLPVKIEFDHTQFQGIKPVIKSNAKGVSFTEIQLVGGSENESHWIAHGQLSSLNMEGYLSYGVEINGHTYNHRVLLTVPLDMDSAQKSEFSIDSIDQSLQVVSTNLFANRPELWSFKSIENVGLELSLWRLGEDGSHQIDKKKNILPEIQQPLPGFNLISDDWNGDGLKDYLFAGTLFDGEGKAKELRLYYLDNNLNPVFTFNLFYEGVIPSTPRGHLLQTIMLETKSFGRLRVPLFLDRGYVPKADQNPDPFAFEENPLAQRYYFLEPYQDKNGQNYMRTRLLWSTTFEKNLRDWFKLNPQDDLSLIGIPTQNIADHGEGLTKLYIHVGSGVLGSLYELKLRDPRDFKAKSDSIHKISTYQYDLEGNVMEEAWDLAKGYLTRVTDFLSIFSQTRAASIIENEQQVLDIGNERETIINLIKSFVSGKSRVHIFETTRYIRIQGLWGGSVVRDYAKVYRSTFLPGSIFNQLTYPALVGSEPQPGLVFDNSNIFSDTIVGYHLGSEGHFYNSVQNTIRFSKSCVTLTPFTRSQGSSVLLFHCKDVDRDKIVTYELR